MSKKLRKSVNDSKSEELSFEAAQAVKKYTQTHTHTVYIHAQTFLYIHTHVRTCTTACIQTDLCQATTLPLSVPGTPWMNRFQKNSPIGSVLLLAGRSTECPESSSVPRHREAVGRGDILGPRKQRKQTLQSIRSGGLSSRISSLQMNKKATKEGGQ